MKLCLYQGTFNPIHNAHLEAANYVLKNFDFDKILFIPAYKPPHKECSMATKELGLHRLEMVKLAVKDYEKFEASDIEFQREEPSYTFYTIKKLYEMFDIEGKISFIIGTDAFRQIETWHRAEELKELIDFILFYRDNDYDEKLFNTLMQKGYHFRLAEHPFKDISSSKTRELVKQNKQIYDIVPFEVAKYIEKNELYKH